METPKDPFQTRTPNSGSGAIPKRVNNVDFWVSATDPSKIKPLISKTQLSKLDPHTTKTQSSRLDSQATNTQAFKLDPHTTKSLKHPKSQPPKPLSPITHKIATRNSFAIFDDLDLGDDIPHDFSQQQVNIESNIPYSQGSISSAEVDDPPEFDSASVNISERESNTKLTSESSNPADAECPQTTKRTSPPKTSYPEEQKKEKSVINSEHPQISQRMNPPPNSPNTASKLKGENAQTSIYKDSRGKIKVKDWSKFVPEEIPPFDKNSKTKFRNTIDHFENEILHFLRERTPSRHRLSIDVDQVRRTVKSFNDLTDANEKTSQQLFKEVKEAAEHYAHFKRGCYHHTTNPLTVPLKHHQKQQQQLSQPHTHQEQSQFQTKDNITFNIGTDNSPPPLIKKQQYKHPTPPDATPLKKEEDNTDTNAPQPIQSGETKTKRMLRSNSTILN